MRGNAIIVWLRASLRLGDNPALYAACQTGRPVIPLFIWAPQEEGHWPPGEGSRWWLSQSLASLAVQFERRGSRLILARGPSGRAVQRVAAESRATAVFYDLPAAAAARRRDALIERVLRGKGIEVRGFESGWLFSPGRVLTGSGGPFRVFTAFWRACLRGAQPPAPLPVPRRLAAPRCWPEGSTLKELSIAPETAFSAKLAASWTPGESSAHRVWRGFLRHGLESYPQRRDRPDMAGTSRLSAHLRAGEISARQLWRGMRGRPSAGAQAWRRQLGWREFAMHLLHHFPHISTSPWRPEFDRFPWRVRRARLRAWQQGRTGYPLVDAGMRQLLATGWMPNRVRMVAASFLVKHLLQPWQQGARWFWRKLVDADLASNTLGWQWAAGCGADAAPYFRIFNPVLQGRRFDPHGEYVRRWLPELAGLNNRWIHQPWAAPPEALAAAGVALGRAYPRPIVEHSAARRRALRALAEMKRRGAGINGGRI